VHYFNSNIRSRIVIVSDGVISRGNLPLQDVSGSVELTVNRIDYDLVKVFTMFLPNFLINEEIREEHGKNFHKVIVNSVNCKLTGAMFVRYCVQGALFIV
jgi:hypothetical protein